MTITKAPARHERLAALALLAVTAAWGSTFFLTKDLLRYLPATDYLGLRFLIAAVVMVIVFAKPTRSLGRADWRAGLILGLLYGVAQIVQTTGLAHTSASLSGFVTGMYVVLTPLLGALLLRDRIPGATWIGVALSLAGLAVLSLDLSGAVSFGAGEWLTLASSVLYALHIIFLGRYSSAETATGLAVVQMIVMAVVCLLGALPGGVVLPHNLADWGAVVYMAVIAGAGAMWAQTWAQAHLPAARAAVLMTMEPVFAAGFAMLFGGEPLTVRIAVGGALIVAAMYVVELGGRVPDVAHPTAP